MARTRTDKIFDNKFDESDYDGRKVKFELSPAYKDSLSAEDRIHLEMLFDEINKVIQVSKYKKLNDPNKEGKIQKLNKVQINEVYGYIINRVKGYSKIELFSAISEYFDVFPTKFYNSLSNSYKEALILELDKKMNVLEKKKIRKLF